MRPPHYDCIPLYTNGAKIGWVGYGMFFEWPSACFQIWVHKSEEPPVEYVSARMSKETKDKLEAIGMREGKPLSMVLREAANQYVQDHYYEREDLCSSLLA